MKKILVILISFLVITSYGQEPNRVSKFRDPIKYVKGFSLGYSNDSLVPDIGWVLNAIDSLGGSGGGGSSTDTVLGIFDSTVVCLDNDTTYIRLGDTTDFNSIWLRFYAFRGEEYFTAEYKILIKDGEAPSYTTDGYGTVGVGVEVQSVKDVTNNRIDLAVIVDNTSSTDVTFNYNIEYYDRLSYAGLQDLLYTGGFGVELNSNEIEVDTSDIPTRIEMLDSFSNLSLGSENIDTFLISTVFAVGDSIEAYHARSGIGSLNADDISDASTVNKFTTAARLSKIDLMEDLADVTDATNVTAAITASSPPDIGDLSSGDDIMVKSVSTGTYSYASAFRINNFVSQNQPSGIIGNGLSDAGSYMDIGGSLSDDVLWTGTSYGMGLGDASTRINYLYGYAVNNITLNSSTGTTELNAVNVNLFANQSTGFIWGKSQDVLFTGSGTGATNATFDIKTRSFQVSDDASNSIIFNSDAGLRYVGISDVDLTSASLTSKSYVDSEVSDVASDVTSNTDDISSLNSDVSTNTSDISTIDDNVGQLRYSRLELTSTDVNDLETVDFVLATCTISQYINVISAQIWVDYAGTAYTAGGAGSLEIVDGTKSLRIDSYSFLTQTSDYSRSFTPDASGFKVVQAENAYLTIDSGSLSGSGGTVYVDITYEIINL